MIPCLDAEFTASVVCFQQTLANVDADRAKLAQIAHSKESEVEK